MEGKGRMGRFESLVPVRSGSVSCRVVLAIKVCCGRCLVVECRGCSLLSVFPIYLTHTFHRDPLW